MVEEKGNTSGGVTQVEWAQIQRRKTDEARWELEDGFRRLFDLPERVIHVWAAALDCLSERPMVILMPSSQSVEAVLKIGEGELKLDFAKDSFSLEWKEAQEEVALLYRWPVASIRHLADPNDSKAGLVAFCNKEGESVGIKVSKQGVKIAVAPDINFFNLMLV